MCESSTLKKKAVGKLIEIKESFEYEILVHKDIHLEINIVRV